jgi:predicted deacylase
MVVERKDSEPTLVSSAHREDYHLSPADGVYEPFFEVGESVEKGQALGQIHFPERHDRLPEEVIAQSSGILLCRRFPAGVSQGDCVAAIARPVAL